MIDFIYFIKTKTKKKMDKLYRYYWWIAPVFKGRESTASIFLA